MLFGSIHRPMLVLQNLKFVRGRTPILASAALVNPARAPGAQVYEHRVIFIIEYFFKPPAQFFHLDPV